jgi:hypothetical protein
MRNLVNYFGSSYSCTHDDKETAADRSTQCVTRRKLITPEDDFELHGNKNRKIWFKQTTSSKLLSPVLYPLILLAN